MREIKASALKSGRIFKVSEHAVATAMGRAFTGPRAFPGAREGEHGPRRPSDAPLYERMGKPSQGGCCQCNGYADLVCPYGDRCFHAYARRYLGGT